MSSLDEFPLSTSAYLSDTQHLSLPQHGAYLLILMTMWRAGGWIDDDDRKLANVCKTTVKKWKQIAPDIRALLLIREGRLSQKRLLSETEKVLKTVAVNKKNGSAGGKAKALKNKGLDVATAKVSLGSRQTTKKTPLPSFFLTNDSEREKEKESKKGKSGIALPHDWKPSPDEMAYGASLGLASTAIESMAEDMRLWAIANANRPVGRKADWPATFKGWMRRDAAKRGGLNGQKYTSRATRVDPVAAAAARRFGGGGGNGSASGPGGQAPSANRMGDERSGKSGGGDDAPAFDLCLGPDGTFR